MNFTQRQPSQLTINPLGCVDHLWLLAFRFPLEREFLSADCLPRQNLEERAR